MTRAQVLVAIACIAVASSIAPADGRGGDGRGGRKQCTAELRAKCTYANLPLCGDTEWPQPQGADNDCCPSFPSCKLPDTCTWAAVAACDLSNLPVCGAEPGTDTSSTGGAGPEQSTGGAGPEQSTGGAGPEQSTGSAGEGSTGGADASTGGTPVEESSTGGAPAAESSTGEAPATDSTGTLGGGSTSSSSGDQCQCQCPVCPTAPAGAAQVPPRPAPSLRNLNAINAVPQRRSMAAAFTHTNLWKAAVRKTPSSPIPNWPQRSGASSCCPSCLPPAPRCDGCQTDPDDLPRCVPGTVPGYVPSTGCFSCRPDEGRVGNCTLAALNECSRDFNSLPSCRPDEDCRRRSQDWRNPCAPPTPPPNPCCLTCKPTWTQRCSRDRIWWSRRNHHNLPLCDRGVRAGWDRHNCCRKCRRPDPDDGDKPDDNGHCTKEKIKRCLANIPVCEDGEEPWSNSTTTGGKPKHCCPECRRPERTCSTNDVVRCKANQPECAEGELPTQIAGECCATCVPKPPKTGCDLCDLTTQICVPALLGGSDCGTGNSTTGTGTGTGTDTGAEPICASKRTLTFRLWAPKGLDETVDDILEIIDNAELGHLIGEILARYCDHSANMERCQRRATQIKYTTFDYEDNGGGLFTITITYPVVPNDASEECGSSTGGDGDAVTDADIYKDALSDDEASSGWTLFSEDDDPFSAAPPRASTATAVTVALAAGGLAFTYRAI